MATRRSFICGSATVAFVPWLAGCLESDDPDTDERDANSDEEDSPGTDEDEDDPDPGEEDTDTDDETDETPEHPFRIDRLIYTNERALEYGEYSPRENETYRGDEMVWIYIELSNVTPVSEGPHLDTYWEVTTSDGEILASTEESVRIPEESLGNVPNDAYLTQGVDPSVVDFPESGGYTLSATVTDVGSGATAEVSSEFSLERFEFDSFVFTDEEPTGFEEYTERPDRTYAPGETVWVYLGVRNVPVDSAGTATLNYTFDVESPDGASWGPDHEREVSWNQVSEDEILVIWDGLSTVPDDPAGSYKLTVTVEEQVNYRRVERTEAFYLRESQ